MNVAEELREHAKRVEKGWRRGGPEGPNQACVLYWTDSLGESHMLSDPARGILQSRLGREGSAVAWNDAKPSEGGPVNRRQVAAELRRAADAWEREQEGVSA